MYNGFLHRFTTVWIYGKKRVSSGRHHFSATISRSQLPALYESRQQKQEESQSV